MKSYLILQKLLNRIVSFRFMELLTSELEKIRISHKEVSKMAGKTEGALNKTVNEGQDPRLSTFLRYWYAVSVIVAKKKIQMVSLDYFLGDKEIQISLEILAQIQEADIFELIKSKKYSSFFLGIKVHIDILTKKEILTDSEISLYNQILSVIKAMEEA